MKIPENFMEDALKKVLEEYGLTEDMSLKDCVEKQIAKKPLAYDDCEQYFIRCTCGKPTDTRFFHGYCTWCGQKLDKQTVERPEF